MPLCSVITCRSGLEEDTEEIVYHRFPTNEEIRAKWVDMTGRDDWVPGADSYICSRHFRESDFFTRRSGKRYLKNGALPCEYVVYRLPDDVPLSSQANEAEIKVECIVNEVNEFEDAGLVDQQADPEPVQEPEYNTQEDEQSEPPMRPFSPLTVIPVREVADSSIATIYDNEPWEHFRPDYFQQRLPASIFEDQNTQEVDTTFEARYRREVRSARNPYPPSDLSSPMQPPPSAREQVKTVEQMPAPTPGPSVSLQKLEDIEAIMSRRRTSKKAVAAALEQVREAKKIKIQLQAGQLNDFDKAHAIILLQEIYNKIIMDVNEKN